VEWSETLVNTFLISEPALYLGVSYGMYPFCNACHALSPAYDALPDLRCVLDF
jgi:hypothetical protein